MITRIDHLGIAVRRLEEAIPFYEKALGLRCERIEEVPGQKVRVAFFEVGGVHLELLEPTSEDGPVARFLSERGGGLHHLAFATSDLSAQLDQARQAGARPVGEGPAAGAGGRQVAFLHPKSTGGLLVELCGEGGH